MFFSSSTMRTVCEGMCAPRVVTVSILPRLLGEWGGMCKHLAPLGNGWYLPNVRRFSEGTMTQRAFINVMACAAAAALLTGCPPAYPKCDTDAQCKEHGEVCVQGQCKECATDNNCKAGFICDANRCV